MQIILKHLYSCNDEYSLLILCVIEFHCYHNDGAALPSLEHLLKRHLYYSYALLYKPLTPVPSEHERKKSSLGKRVEFFPLHLETMIS